MRTQQLVRVFRTEGESVSQRFANAFKASDHLIVRCIKLFCGALALEAKALEYEVSCTLAISISARKIVCVAASRLIDLIIPSEKPYDEVQQNFELFILRFRPPSCNEESKVGSFERLEPSFIVEDTVAVNQSECRDIVARFSPLKSLV
jgi:hypothetical protein